MENHYTFRPKVVTVAYRRWSFTKLGSNFKALTGKFCCFGLAVNRVSTLSTNSRVPVNIIRRELYIDRGK